MESTGTQRRRPDYLAKTVTDRLDEQGRQTGKGRWREIGVAFYNQGSDTFTILLDALPANNKLVLTRPKEQPRQEESGRGFQHDDVAPKRSWSGRF